MIGGRDRDAARRAATAAPTRCSVRASPVRGLRRCRATRLLLPVDAEHLAVDARADAEHRDAVAARESARFGRQGHRERQGDGAGVAQRLERGEVDRLRSSRATRTSACGVRRRPGGKRSWRCRRATTRARREIARTSRAAVSTPASMSCSLSVRMKRFEAVALAEPVLAACWRGPRRLRGGSACGLARGRTAARRRCRSRW